MNKYRHIRLQNTCTPHEQLYLQPNNKYHIMFVTGISYSQFNREVLITVTKFTRNQHTMTQCLDPCSQDCVILNCTQVHRLLTLYSGKLTVWMISLCPSIDKSIVCLQIYTILQDRSRTSNTTSGTTINKNSESQAEPPPNPV